MSSSGRLSAEMMDTTRGLVLDEAESGVIFKTRFIVNKATGERKPVYWVSEFSS
jgi:hypothetical protein